MQACHDLADHPTQRGARPIAPRTRLLTEFLMPLATIACVVVLVLTFGIHSVVAALDEESAARERQLARNGLALRMEEVAQLVVRQTNRDSSGFDAEYVLDAGDRPLFAAVDGEVTAPGRYADIAGRAGGLVAKVRRDEAARGPIRKLAGPGMLSKPIQASAFKAIGGRLTILTATLVQPDFGTALPSGPRAPIVVTEMRVDPPFLAQFSKRFLLDGVSVRLPSQPARPGRIEIPVHDDTGVLQTWLTWQPLDPGYGMLHRMALPFFGGMLFVLIVAAFELRRIFRAARDLIERDELAQLVNWPSIEFEEEHWPPEPAPG